METSDFDYIYLDIIYLQIKLSTEPPKRSHRIQLNSSEDQLTQLLAAVELPDSVTKSSSHKCQFVIRLKFTTKVHD